MLELSPSLLSADFTNLKSDLEVLDKNGVKYLHLDVMDGMFVPNISFGPMIIKQLRPLTNMVFDVHLMIEEPDRYVQNFKDSGADILTVHYEACKHLHRTISVSYTHLDVYKRQHLYHIKLERIHQHYQFKTVRAGRL